MNYTEYNMSSSLPAHDEGQPQAGPGAPAPKPSDPRADRSRPQQVSVEDFPFVALFVQSTGIHPSTARLVSIDALVFNAAGAIGQEFHAVLNPRVDPGPRHQHGLSHDEVAEGQSFSHILKPLDRLIDGRTLILHDTAFTWGFIVSEARRAMTAAARQNRARNRGNGRNRRRRHKVGHVPTPVAIVDTLATAYRQSVHLTDTRIAAVARRSGLDAPDPRATIERAQLPEKVTSRATTELIIELYRAQTTANPDAIARSAPDDLRADHFGLQRSHVRIDAAAAAPIHPNPGTYSPERGLVRGMEVVIAPDISMDPDVLIEACQREELSYVEKLSRESSVVVCNVRTDLVGKPMHAERKDIPLLDDAAFMKALETISEAEPDSAATGETPKPHKPGAGAPKGGRDKQVPNSNNRNNSQRPPSRRRRRRSRRPSGGANPAQPNNGAEGATEDKQGAGSSHGPDSGSQPGGNKNSGGRNNRNRRGKRRRGGRGKRQRQNQGKNPNGSGGTTPKNND